MPGKIKPRVLRKAGAYEGVWNMHGCLAGDGPVRKSAQSVAHPSVTIITNKPCDMLRPPLHLQNQEINMSPMGLLC